MQKFTSSDLIISPRTTIKNTDNSRGHRVERMIQKLRVPIALVLGIALLAPSAAAQDVAYGEYLSSQCTTCHQLSGKDNGIPSIVGWDTESFVAVMDSYKRKERENKAMQTIAASMGDEEIAALAAYFATLKPKE